MWKLTEKMFVTNVDLKAARPVKKSPCVVGIVVQLVEAKVKRPESIGEKPVNIPKGRRRQGRYVGTNQHSRRRCPAL